MLTHETQCRVSPVGPSYTQQEGENLLSLFLPTMAPGVHWSWPGLIPALEGDLAEIRMLCTDRAKTNNDGKDGKFNRITPMWDP